MTRVGSQGQGKKKYVHLYKLWAAEIIPESALVYSLHSNLSQIISLFLFLIINHGETKRTHVPLEQNICSKITLQTLQETSHFFRQHARIWGGKGGVIYEVDVLTISPKWWSVTYGRRSNNHTLYLEVIHCRCAPINRCIHSVNRHAKHSDF
jgi:hypothetical protein